jgi:hypothetical protein
MTPQEIEAKVIELDRLIAGIRGNIRDLVERAAGEGGAGSEEANADLLARQEAQLAELMRARDELVASAKRMV